MTNDPKATLKPCPFCGGNPTLVSENAFEDGTIWQIYCSNDDCLVQPATTGSFFQDETLSDWNTRAAAPMTEDELKEIRDISLRLDAHISAQAEKIAALEAENKRLRFLRQIDEWIFELSDDDISDEVEAINRASRAKRPEAIMNALQNILRKRAKREALAQTASEVKA